MGAEDTNTFRAMKRPEALADRRWQGSLSVEKGAVDGTSIR
jgi:hypothetical protein